MSEKKVLVYVALPDADVQQAIKNGFRAGTFYNFAPVSDATRRHSLGVELAETDRQSKVADGVTVWNDVLPDQIVSHTIYDPFVSENDWRFEKSTFPETDLME